MVVYDAKHLPGVYGLNREAAPELIPTNTTQWTQFKGQIKDDSLSHGEDLCPRTPGEKRVVR